MKQDDFSIKDLHDLFSVHVKYCIELKKIWKGKSKKGRMPNFPSEISENLVKFIIEKEEGFLPNWNSNCGDLVYKEKQLEVKAFASTGPSSFGPTEKWDVIYFLDAKDYLNGNFKLYKLKLANTDEIWRNIKVNKKQTFADQCDSRRRPRMGFRDIYKQLKEHFTVIFDGNINTLFNF